MLTYVARRILYSIPVLLVASFIAFWGVRSPSTRPRSTARPGMRPGSIAEKRRELGLDRPIVVQWWTWITHFVRGDWGMSSSTNDASSR